MPELKNPKRHYKTGKHMQVEIKNASLETMVVTIQTLHVSGKQMTLAVFRQLPEGKERKNSVLWGVVRYKIKDEGDVWLVFSHDGLLFRRALDLRGPWARKTKLLDLTSLFKNREEWFVRFHMNIDSAKKAEKEQELLELRKEVKLAQLEYDEAYSYDAALCAREKKLAAGPQLFIAV